MGGQDDGEAEVKVGGEDGPAADLEPSREVVSKSPEAETEPRTQPRRAPQAKKGKASGKGSPKGKKRSMVSRRKNDGLDPRSFAESSKKGSTY